MATKKELQEAVLDRDHFENNLNSALVNNEQLDQQNNELRQTIEELKDQLD